jgi:hypothetical protein
MSKRSAEQALQQPPSVSNLVGDAGRKHVRKLLTKSNNPQQTIKQFQASQPIAQSRNLKPVMELLHLHGVSRNAVYSKMLGDMCTHMLATLKTMPEDRLVPLLESCFDYITMPEVRAIPIQVRLFSVCISFRWLSPPLPQTASTPPQLRLTNRHHHHQVLLQLSSPKSKYRIPQHFLLRLSASPDILSPAIIPVGVLREVWSHGDEAVFRDFVFQAISGLNPDSSVLLSLRDPTTGLATSDSAAARATMVNLFATQSHVLEMHPGMHPSPSKRRTLHSTVQELCGYIGECETQMVTTGHPLALSLVLSYHPP